MMQLLQHGKLTDRPHSSTCKATGFRSRQTGSECPGQIPMTATAEIFMTSSSLRKQFAFYAMMGNPTNFSTMTLTSFLRFVKDCALHQLCTPALTDADLYRVFAQTVGTAKVMTFRQWLTACEILLRSSKALEVMSTARTSTLHFLMRPVYFRGSRQPPKNSSN